jgi:hypothetical protein
MSAGLNPGLSNLYATFRNGLAAKHPIGVDLISQHDWEDD